MGCRCRRGEQRKKSSQEVWSRLIRQVLWSTNPSFGKCDDVEFVAVSEVVECSNMFRGEHGAGN